MAETKAQLQAKFDEWQDKVEEALKSLEGQSFELDKVKTATAILLELVGRPEDDEADDG